MNTGLFTIEDESTDARNTTGRFVYDDLLTPGMAQWDEYTHHLPTEWKHRRLVFWIREDTEYLKTLAGEREAISADLAKAENALAKVKRVAFPNRHDVEAAEYQVVRYRCQLKQNAQDRERTHRHLRAWRLRHQQGVKECGFEDLIGEG